MGNRLGDVCSSVIVDDKGHLLLTSRAHAVMMKEQGQLQCPVCGRFLNGPRGLRDHQLVAHGSTYEDAVEVASGAATALIHYVAKPSAEILAAQCLGKRKLLERQSENARKRLEDDPGIVAIKAGDLSTVKDLLGEGWDPCKVRAKDGSSPLEWAAGMGELEIIRLLVNHAGGECLLTAGPGLARTPLHWACRKGHKDVVEYFLSELKVPVDTPMADRTTPFHYAVYGAQMEVCALLVQNGANVHTLNDHGCNAVHWATLAGSVPMLDYLRSLNVDFSSSNNNNHSSMHKAAQRGKYDVCMWLAQECPEIDWAIADKSGMMPWALAQTNGFHGLAKDLESVLVKSQSVDI